MANSFVGIDPGLTGGIAWITPEESGAIVMPVLDDKPNLDVIGGLLLVHRPSLVMIETPQTRQGLSAVAILTTGVNWGMLAGLLSGRGQPWQEVSPNAWKKSLGLPTASERGPKEEDDKAKQTRLSRAKKERKAAAVRMAVQLFPAVDLISPGCRVQHDGMAEALLLAEYARRTTGGGR